MSSVAECQDTNAQAVADRILADRFGTRLSDIKTYVDLEYNKIYSVFLVLDDTNRKFVLKKASIEPELYSYLSIFKPEDPVPKIYYHEAIDGDSCWLVLEHNGDSDLRDLNLDAHILAAEALAVFHSNHRLRSSVLIPELYSLKSSMKKNAQFLDRHTPKNDDPNIDLVRSIGQSIFNKFNGLDTSIINGDLLSMNIVFDGRKVTIIDWSACEKGCDVQDLGRWLGDLRHANSPGWIKKSWEKPILQAYYRKRTEMKGV